MKRFFSLLSLLLLIAVPAFADKNTITIHPGETVYARFEVSGRKITLTSASTEKNESAQVVMTFDQEIQKTGFRRLKIENKFPKDLVYKAEMRSIAGKHSARFKTTPIVGGKVGFDEYPPIVDEVAAYDFKLER